MGGGEDGGGGGGGGGDGGSGGGVENADSKDALHLAASRGLIGVEVAGREGLEGTNSPSTLLRK